MCFQIRKFNQLKAGVFLSYANMIIGIVVSIVYTPLMLRLLGQSEYGLYSLVASVVAYLGILNFGFGSTYVRYYSRYKTLDEKVNIEKLNGMFLIIFSFLGFIAAISGTILAFNSELIFGSKLSLLELNKAKYLMLILVLNLAISFPNIVFTSFITANEKFIFQKMLLIIKTIVHPFVILPILIMGYGSVGMVIFTTLLNFIIEIINAHYCLNKLKMKFCFSKFDFILMKELTVFSSYIFINLVIDQVNWNVDKYILGRFRGTLSVAVYGIAAQLNSYYSSISTAVSTVFIPRVHRMAAMPDNDRMLTELFARIGRVQYIILLLILSGLIFFGRPFINMWAGRNYDNSYFVLLLLAIPLTIPLIQNIGIEIQRAKNLHKFRSWVYLFIAIVNITISIPLAKNYGEIGAAMGTSLSLILGNGFIMNWYYHKVVGLDIKFFWKEMFKFCPSLVLPIIIGIIINIYVDLYHFVPFLFYSFTYTTVFCLSMWLWGMNTYEKDLVRIPLKRILSKKTTDTESGEDHD